MNLVHEIYEFFNEAEEDTLTEKRARRSRSEMEPPEKTKKYSVDINPEEIKSSFKPGSVHEIRFTITTPGTGKTRKVYSIYRKLSEEEYKKLVPPSNLKVLTLVDPASEVQHDRDVYYITIPTVKYGKRTGKDYTYFVYLTKNSVDSLSAEEKEKLNLKLVPISDISKGINNFPLDFFTFGEYISSLSKEKQVRAKRASKVKDTASDEEALDVDLSALLGLEDIEPETEPKEEEPENVKAAKKKAAIFMLDDKVERTFSQIIKNYDISNTTSNTEKERKEAKDKLGEMLKRFLDSLFDMTDNELERKAIIDYSVAQKLENKKGLLTLIKTSYDNMESIKETLKEASEIKDDQVYSASVKYGSGKSKEVKLNGKSLKKLIGDQEFVYSRDIPFERVIDDPRREVGMTTVKGTIKVEPPVGGKLKLVGRRTPEGEPIAYDPAAKAPEEKDDVPTRSLKTSISGQGVRSFKVPVNMGVKMVDVKPSQLAYKYYIISLDDKQIAHGTNDWSEAKEKAKQLGDRFRAVQKAALPALGVKIDEALSLADKETLKNYRISFTIQSDMDPDKQYNIADNVKEFKDEKTKFTIVLKEVGVLTFDKSGTASFKYSKDNKDYQALNIPDDLTKLVKKSFEPAKPEDNSDAQLEAYIRKRIKQAIKEAEISQYWGYQGKDVKKKRLEEYMKKYEWGFQDSDNPHTHSIGSEIHSIVNKLVHELGDEGVAMFNSYAPKGYEISNPDDLNDMSDSPLGSQLTQPYNPDSLTARGGRVAEMTGPVAYKGQGADQLDRLVKDMSPKLKDAIKAKSSAMQAKDLITVFRQRYKVSDDVKDDEIYNKVKIA